MQSDEEIPKEPDEVIPEDPTIEPKEFLVSGEEEAAPLDGLESLADGAPAPDDSASPADAVDDMLSAEMLPEGMDLMPAPSAEVVAEQGPTFHLQFTSLSNEARTMMKKALEAQGVSISDKAWSSAVPVVSQLNEYQAIVLLQAARALGVQAKAHVQSPSAGPTEDDLALGDLSEIPETVVVTAESAPSVVLAKGEKEVMLCTPDSVPGGAVRESFGIVLAHRSIARRLFREEDLRDKLQKELRSVPNRATVPMASSHLQLLLRDLMVDLRKSALSRGANAVLGVKLEAFPESGASDPQLEQLRLVAFGTAAVVEKVSS